MTGLTLHTAGLDETRAHLGGMTEAVRRSLMAAVWGEATRLVDVVKFEKLEGQVLNPRTRRLQRSIHAEWDMSGGDKVVARVGTNVEYAAYHEYGFTGAQDVGDHWRVITQAFGKDITPRAVFVREYIRHVVYPEHSFLRSALAEQKYGILAALHLAVQGSLEA